jgi:hypothetical protein
VGKHDGTTLEEGDQVRHVKTGRIGTLAYVNDKSAEDRNEADETWAELEPDNDDFFLQDLDGPNEVVLVHKAKDIPKKLLPTRVELSEFMGSALLNDYNGIRITETDIGSKPDGEVYIYGTSATGQRFGAHVYLGPIEYGS